MTAAWSAAPAPRTELQRQGSVTGWSIRADGSVALRLRDLAAAAAGADDPASRALWFVTPPSQTSTTRFEELVLLAVLQLRVDPAAAPADAALVVVRGDVSNEVTGRSIEDAIPLLSIARLE
ncbi:MAG: hypothetical protein AB7O97_04385 [Planctomycetota bacterium]